MTSRGLLLTLILFVSSAPVLADEVPDPNALAAKGDDLLAKADLAGALKAYAAAAKAAPENKDYRAKALQIQRVMSLKRHVAANEPSARWEKMVISLHVFFHRNGLRGEALKLDREAHAKADSATTASLLAETLLYEGREKEVLELLGGARPRYASAQNWIYLGIAQARCGTDAAKKQAAKSLGLAVEDGIPEGPGIRFDLARIHALLGDHAKATEAIRTCLEQCPLTSVERVRDLFRKCPDVKAVLATGAGAAALSTASKVKPSGCSGGDSCGSCPKRGGCGSEEKKPEGGDDEKKEKEGCGGCDGK